MKAIIDNKLYDTDNATKIFSFIRKLKGEEVFFRPGYFYTDTCKCDFYKTVKDNYFEHNIDRNSINVITENEVRDIIRKLDADKYIKLFGEVELA